MVKTILHGLKFFIPVLRDSEIMRAIGNEILELTERIGRRGKLTDKHRPVIGQYAGSSPEHPELISFCIDLDQ
jgi:hypothetical protein